ncbi:DUF3349 domain-containing protein [Mycobacterium saskatchewanense]|uniref:DUF3349 domain-containing protein n=1 Tax=Mycobacterium saskatchewanense TaxID=220927 RepID=UPI001E5CBB2C|nr:DUF3349 domain-containing protein [Mycobacterium saskatchewanense]
MSASGVVARIVRFLRVGYPQGVPATDTFPLLALLRRRLTDEEVMQIGEELVRHGDLPADATTIQVMVTKITDQLPSHDEVERVRRHLENRGWPASDDFQASNG